MKHELARNVSLFFGIQLSLSNNSPKDFCLNIKFVSVKEQERK